MSLFSFLKNLFTGFRPYNFVSKRMRAQPPEQKHLHLQDKPQKKFTSKHRYTHTTKKWNIGNK